MNKISYKNHLENFSEQSSTFLANFHSLRIFNNFLNERNPIDFNLKIYTDLLSGMGSWSPLTTICSFMEFLELLVVLRNFFLTKFGIFSSFQWIFST
jgi:hypothetical protein